MGAGGAGAAVGAGAGADVAAGAGVFEGVVLPPLEPEDDELSDDEDSFFAGFFFLGSDFSAGSAAAPATLVVIDADVSSTGFVPSALVALAVPLSPEPPVALPMPNATAKARMTAATVMPI